jgi:ParB family chromosome partitioning protein
VSRIAHARHHLLLVSDLILDVPDVPAGVTDVDRVDPLALARRLESSERLRQRRFELLPLTGPTAAFTEVQGRAPGVSTSLEGLGELISSIASVGVLQPVLVEEMPGGRAHRLVSGERRLRACRRGAVLDPENPHFQAIPAVICPGPLSEAERRTWQLVENLAREELQPGELAAALMFERCALLTVKLLRAGVPVPEALNSLDDPIERFRTLERLRAGSGRAAGIGAPWREVLSRLGIQLGHERARQMVRAFASLPPELSDQLDEEQVSLHTRMKLLELRRGRAEAADELWAAVRARRAPQLLAGAVAEALAHPGLGTDAAIERAKTKREEANQARSEVMRARAAATRASSKQWPHGDAGDAAQGDASKVAEVNGQSVQAAINGLRALLEEMRAGARPSRYDAGSVRLLATEVLDYLGEAA